MMFILWSIVVISVIVNLVVCFLYIRGRYEYTSVRPKWLLSRESDIGKDIERLVEKLAQIGEWMDNSEQTGSLTDEIRRDIGDVEWRVWKETYSYFALRSKDEELKKLALRNLSQVQGAKAIRRALKYLKGIKDESESDTMLPSEELKGLSEAVIGELEDLLKQAEDKEKELVFEGFDVFLSYNTEDLSLIQKLNEEFKARGLRTWFAPEQVTPGMIWLDELESQISNIRAVCIFVGGNGIGPWEEVEIKAFLTEFVHRGCLVIPVILPNAKEVPDLPVILKQIAWCDLREGYKQNVQKLANALNRKRH